MHHSAASLSKSLKWEHSQTFSWPFSRRGESRSTQRTIESTQRFEFPGAPMDFSKLATAGCGKLSTVVDVEFADLAKLRPKQCYQHHIVVCMTARSITIVDVGMQCLGKFHLAIFKFHDVRDLLGLTALLCSPSLHRFCTLGKISRGEILQCGGDISNYSLETLSFYLLQNDLHWRKLSSSSGCSRDLSPILSSWRSNHVTGNWESLAQRLIDSSLSGHIQR